MPNSHHRLAFRLCRESIHLSADELAPILGVNIRKIRAWESGQAPVPPKRLEQLEQLALAYESGVNQRIQQTLALVSEQVLDPAEALIALPVYMSRQSYAAIHPEAELTARQQRLMTYDVGLALESEGYRVVYVDVDPEAFFSWRDSGGPAVFGLDANTPIDQLLMVWASVQAEEEGAA